MTEQPTAPAAGEMTLQDLLEGMEQDGLSRVEVVTDLTLPRFFWGQAARLGQADPDWSVPAAAVLTPDCLITAAGPGPLPLDYWAGEDEATTLGDTFRVGDIHLMWILDAEDERALYVSGELRYEAAPPQLLELAMAAWRLRSLGAVLPVQLEIAQMVTTTPHPAAPLLPHLASFTLEGLGIAFPASFSGAGIVLSPDRLGPITEDPRVTMLYTSASAAPDGPPYVFGQGAPAAV